MSCEGVFCNLPSIIREIEWRAPHKATQCTGLCFGISWLGGSGPNHWLVKLWKDKAGSLVGKMDTTAVQVIKCRSTKPTVGDTEEGHQPKKSERLKRAGVEEQHVLVIMPLWWTCATLTLPDTVTFPTGFTPGPQQLLGDPFQGMRKPMSPVTAQVQLSFLKCDLLLAFHLRYYLWGGELDCYNSWRWFLTIIQVHL